MEMSCQKLISKGTLSPSNTVRRTGTDLDILMRGGVKIYQDHMLKIKFYEY